MVVGRAASTEVAVLVPVMVSHWLVTLLVPHRVVALLVPLAVVALPVAQEVAGTSSVAAAA